MAAPQLRPYQQELKEGVYNNFLKGHKDVLAVLPTGGGKTVVFSTIASEIATLQSSLTQVLEGRQNVGVVAHRQELLAQISLSLAKCGVPHRILAPDAVVKRIAKLHGTALGTCFINHNARVGVIGVDSVTRPSTAHRYKNWIESCGFIITDEAHHILKKNKWGTARKMFVNALHLGVSATPCRADGKGLGRDSDGFFDSLVEGPPMHWLIENNYLTKYRIFNVPNDIDFENVDVSQTTGDYSKVKLSKAVHKSHIVGDVVGHYQRVAPGKLCIVFAVDVEHATEIAASFVAAGVPAEMLCAKTPDLERAQVLDRFRQRRTLVLTNVDLFGEGFDLPSLEVVSMARPTNSYGLYAQKFGRALRTMEGKEHAIILDHVGNVMRHGLPDRDRVWTLEAGEKKPRATGDTIPLRTCVACMGAYERILKVCPYCKTPWAPEERKDPESVDGDLLEMTPEALDILRKGEDAIGRSLEEVRTHYEKFAISGPAVSANVNRHAANQEWQEILRNSIGWWGAWKKTQGYDESAAYKLFYWKFNIDVLSARGLKRKEAMALHSKIIEDIPVA